MTFVPHTRSSTVAQHQPLAARLSPLVLSLAVGGLLILLIAYLLSAALRTPPQWTLEVGGPEDGRWTSGFFLREQSDGLPFRWAGPEARLLLHGADAAPLAIELRVSGEQIFKSGDPRLSLVAEQPRVSGPVSTTITVKEGWHRYRVLLPPAAPGLDPPAYALVSGTSRPGPQDGRDLGAALSTVRLVPLDSDAGAWLLRGWPFHPRALLFAWALALLFGALALAGRKMHVLAGGSVRLPVPVGGYDLLVGALVLLLGGGLVAWARTNPYTLAALLPPMPWTLTVLTVALLAGPTVRGLTTLVRQASLSPRLTLWGGLALLLAAQGLLNGQTLVPLGIVLALLALALVIVAEGMRPGAEDDLTPRPPLLGGEGGVARPGLLLGGIFLLALVLRFVQLDTLPYGLWRDEARHGLVALRILEDPDYRPIYVAEGGVNMPALTFYPFALTLKLWGVHPWTMRPLTALAGALTVLPLYGLTRRLFGVRPALLAALLYAAAAWHLTVSRFSFPTVFDPLFGLTALWLLVVGLEADRRPQTADRGQHPVLSAFCLLLSGVCMGLAVQTYHTGRVVPLVGGVLALGLLWEAMGKGRGARDKEREVKGEGQKASLSLVTRYSSLATRHSSLVTRWLTGLLALALGFLLVAGPMLAYALTRQAQFNDRVGGVFLLSEDALKGRAPLAALDESLGKHLLLFNVRGDENGRHAPPNRPGLDFASGLGFLLGGALLLRRGSPWGWRGLFLFAAIGISLLPSALAVDAPHGMRAVGAIAFACVVAALGVEWLWKPVQDERRKTKDESKGVADGIQRSSFVFRLSSFVVLLVVLLLNIYTYFFAMKVDPAVWVSFYPVHTQAGAYVRELREQDPQRQIFVAAGVATNPVFVYLTHGYGVQTFDAGVPSEEVRPGAIFILSGYTYTRERVTLAPYLGTDPQPVASGPLFPDGRSPSFVAYPAAPRASAQP